MGDIPRYTPGYREERDHEARSMPPLHHPFHCWTERASPYVTRFTVGQEREERGTPVWPTLHPWPSYYPAVYGPAPLPGWTSVPNSSCWESVLSLLACWVHRANLLGSKREKGLGESLPSVLKSSKV